MKLSSKIKKHSIYADLCKNHQELLLRFIDSSSHIAIIKDPSFHYISANKTFLDLLGYQDVSEIIGKTDSEILKEIKNEQQLNKILTYDRKACTLPAGEHIEAEITLPVKGEETTFSLSKFPIRDDRGALLGIGSLLYDSSERKALEAELYETQVNLKEKLSSQEKLYKVPLKIFNSLSTSSRIHWTESSSPMPMVTPYRSINHSQISPVTLLMRSKEKTPGS